MWFFIIISALFIIGLIVQNQSGRKLKERYENKPLKINQNNIEELINSSNISITKKFVSRDCSGALVFDNNSNKILLITSSHKLQDGTYNFAKYIYNLNDIYEAEVSTDNTSLLKTRRGSQLGGVLAGSLLAGGVGAIIGGLSSTKYKDEKIRKINLKIRVNDSEHPFHQINFLNNVDIYTNDEIKDGYGKESSEVKIALEKIEYWFSLIKASNIERATS